MVRPASRRISRVRRYSRNAQRAPECFSLQDSHPLRWPVPAAFGQHSIHTRSHCRVFTRARSTPVRQRRQPITPHGFGLLPVRSPLLRESSLFLGVLRCFSSPGTLPDQSGCPAVRRAGCPIRTPPDRRLPAPPWGISPRGRVLHRPPTPRHPPCAHHCGHSSVADTSRSVASGSRAEPARAKETRVPRPTRRLSSIVDTCRINTVPPFTENCGSSAKLRHRV